MENVNLFALIRYKVTNLMQNVYNRKRRWLCKNERVETSENFRQNMLWSGYIFKL